MGKLVHLQNSNGNTTEKKQNKNSVNKKSRYRLVDFRNNYYIGRKPVYNSKCDFDVHSAGLMLSGDFGSNYNHISILAQEVVSITLTRGKETIDTFYMSPMHVLSKLRVPNRLARFFSFHPSEYKILETRIVIEGREQRLELITSGYNFEKLRRNFKKHGYSDKLQIESGASVDISSFRNTIPEAEPHFSK